MVTTADAIVIGAGVIGAAVALELSKLGLDVVVVDKAGGAGLGSTSASSAIVRFNYSTRDGVATAWEAKHCWEGWDEHLGHRDGYGLASFVRTGMVMLDAPISPRERVTPLFEAVGVPYEAWDPELLSQHLPGIDVGRYWPPKPVDHDAFFSPATGKLGALYTPDTGYVDDPQLAAHNLAAAAEDRGATLLFGRTVQEVCRRGNRVRGVRLSQATDLEAPIVVNAAGPWSGAVNRLAGVGGDFTIGVRPLRQEVHHVPAPAGYGEHDRVGPAIADLDLGTYLRPAPGDNLLVGGTEPECDALEWVEDPDDANPLVTARLFGAQVTRAARRLVDLRVPTSPKGVAGVYDVADDWTPIYDRTDLDGFYVAMGTSGNQFKNAPLVGRFLAAIVQAVEAGHDHDADPVSYHCEHTANRVDLGAFSRHRGFNAKASGTVMG